MTVPRAAILSPSPVQKAPDGERPGVTGLTNWRAYAVAGYALIFATFGVVGTWATFARLDRAVISPGVVVA
ncbi:HlyD family type I secretion periplasmic adaptor subunit, partial [Escherichia coli]|nr:HlyD family type I secretion periplasmic adaptor subunit [Escherichia coli]